jgi:hypothetical protein
MLREHRNLIVTFADKATVCDSVAAASEEHCLPHSLKKLT